MAGFRRVQLRGSDELFRHTNNPNGGSTGGRVQEDGTGTLPFDERGQSKVEVPGQAQARTQPQLIAKPAAGSRQAAPAASAKSPLVRLSEVEIEALANALQHLKFPQKSGSRPSIEDFEQWEELRQKLLSFLR